MNIQQLNALDQDAAQEQLRQCCAAPRWVAAMVQARPFIDIPALLAAADKYWATMHEEDYLEAFSAHPQIGNLATLEAKFVQTQAIAAGEQASVEQADSQTLNTLAQGNQDYLSKFGFIFIVCATGKAATEMLTLLQSRLQNTREQELKIAALEQHKITILRLNKQFNALDPDSREATKMSQITTHILDTAAGQPAAGVHITLSRLETDQWRFLSQGTTNSDGRVTDLCASTTPLSAGTYAIKFAVSEYFLAKKQPAFYPWVEVVFQLDGSAAHYHIPLLISPFGYSTYRGS